MVSSWEEIFEAASRAGELLPLKGWDLGGGGCGACRERDRFESVVVREVDVILGFADAKRVSRSDLLSAQSFI